MQGVRAALRASTAAAHTRVEDALGLLDPALTARRVTDALAVMHGFWAANEPALDTWAAASPALAGRLEWPRRRRTALLRDDLTALGVRADAVEPGPTVLTGADDAQALGWLYVAEGSTLGGAVIHRALASTTLPRLASFTPYAEGPGPMWRRYLDVLEGWAGHDADRGDAVVAAAGTIFSALAERARSGPVEAVA